MASQPSTSQTCDQSRLHDEVTRANEALISLRNRLTEAETIPRRRFETVKTQTNDALHSLKFAGKTEIVATGLALYRDLASNLLPMARSGDEIHCSSDLDDTWRVALESCSASIEDLCKELMQEHGCNCAVAYDNIAVLFIRKLGNGYKRIGPVTLRDGTTLIRHTVSRKVIKHWDDMKQSYSILSAVDIAVAALKCAMRANQDQDRHEVYEGFVKGLECDCTDPILERTRECKRFWELAQTTATELSCEWLEPNSIIRMFLQTLLDFPCELDIPNGRTRELQQTLKFYERQRFDLWPSHIANLERLTDLADLHDESTKLRITSLEADVAALMCRTSKAKEVRSNVEKELQKLEISHQEVDQMADAWYGYDEEQTTLAIDVALIDDTVSHISATGILFSQTAPAVDLENVAMKAMDLRMTLKKLEQDLVAFGQRHIPSE